MTKWNLKDMNVKDLNVKDLDVKKFLELGNRYAAQSDWKDFAMVKLFLGTYIPLMKKVFEIALEMDEEEE